MNVIRTCVRCSRDYPAGGFRAHLETCPEPPASRNLALRKAIAHLLEQGSSQVEVARVLGLSRQRVSAIVRGDKS